MWRSCKMDPPDYDRDVVLIYETNAGWRASVARKVRPGESEEGWKLNPLPEAWFIPLMWAEMPLFNNLRYEKERI